MERLLSSVSVLLVGVLLTSMVHYACRVDSANAQKKDELQMIECFSGERTIYQGVAISSGIGKLSVKIHELETNRIVTITNAACVITARSY